ncbi:SRPBCC domain-containing protein [candidate division KSB1 bacterium]|nr:SRPBCC domain-containing protein [candidate division KSB1 bacterium]
MANGSETTLNLKRIFNAPREKVFRAWTDPNALKEWFHGMDDWTTPVHEIDLQVGGKYRLGMQPPDGDTTLCGLRHLSGNTAAGKAGLYLELGRSGSYGNIGHRGISGGRRFDGS